MEIVNLLTEETRLRTLVTDELTGMCKDDHDVSPKCKVDVEVLSKET